MMKGGTTPVRSDVQLSFNIYLHYTFFDKPYYFNAIEDDDVTENEFFDWDKIKFSESEEEKRKQLKGSF